MIRYDCQTPSRYILLMATGCWMILHTSFAQAANEEIIAAARDCAKQEWVNKVGRERAQAYRKAVNCFKDLYVRVAGSARLNEAFKKELGRRLDELESAYHASRDVCSLRAKAGLEDRECGTASLSPHEFIHVLKTMIRNEDAGWVRPDPALVEALELDK